ncbi:MAG TPA: alpha/beta hydrolase [Myxococcales bacterium]|nr:alpha/beta hydrolase [Myxococcales bacterium]
MTELEHLDGVPVAHRRVQLSEVALHVAEAGEGDRLVVLLHGFPEHWYSWRAQIPALVRAGYRVAAPDMRGYNTSDKPPNVSDYDVSKLAADVDQLVAALGATRADVVGHDWGGAVAWCFAMFHPRRLRKLVVMNAPHPVHYQTLVRRDLEQVRLSWYVLFFQLPVLPEQFISRNNYAALGDAFLGLRTRGRMSEEELQRYKDAFSQPKALTSAINYYRAAVRRSVRERLQHVPVSAPVQVIWGQRDHYLKADLAEPLPGLAPDLRVDRIPEASHFVHMDQPERVNELLLEFLR